MKVNDILDQEQLNELNLKHALAAGIVGTSLMSPMKAGNAQQDMTHRTPPQQRQVTQNDLQPVTPTAKHIYPKAAAMVKRVEAKYTDVDEELASKIVELAHKYEKPTFPRAKDILSIIGVESSFDPEAQSALKRDPALGLMQVRPGVWNINPQALEDVESQIRYGSDILHYYYKKLHNKEAAVQAYNVGLTEYNKGNGAPQYLGKYNNEMQLYAGI